jgi:ribosomal protein L12E/L44/L45/RPP1/RPP2
MTTLHRNVAILRVDQASVLDEIRAVLPLDEHVLGWISPTEAIIDPATMKTLIETLEARSLAALVRKAGQGASDAPPSSTSSRVT